MEKSLTDIIRSKTLGKKQKLTALRYSYKYSHKDILEALSHTQNRLFWETLIFSSSPTDYKGIISPAMKFAHKNPLRWARFFSGNSRKHLRLLDSALIDSLSLSMPIIIAGATSSSLPPQTNLLFLKRIIKHAPNSHKMILRRNIAKAIRCGAQLAVVISDSTYSRKDLLEISDREILALDRNTALNLILITSSKYSK